MVGGAYLITFLLVIPIVAIQRGEDDVVDYFGLHLPKLKAALIGAGAFIFYVGCVDFVFRSIDRSEGMQTMQTIWKSCPDAWRAGFVWNVLILAAVCEEVLFRGFLLEGLRKPFLNRDTGKWMGLHWGEWLAIIVSSGIWSGLHAQYKLPEVMALFFMGMVLGVVRLRTGSLFLVIGLHFLNNLISLLQIVTD